MFDVKAAYFPIGRKTFDMEAAQTYYEQSISFLKGSCRELVEPSSVISSLEELNDFTENSAIHEADCIIFHMITFADAEFIVKVIEQFSQPIMVWSVREPEVGGRLRLNSLTGGNSTCNALKFYERNFDFMYGNPTEAAIQQKFNHLFAAAQTFNKLSELVVGVVGDHPPGFFFSGTDERELHKKIGVKIHQLDLYQIFKKSMELPESEWKPMLEQANSKVVGLNKSDETSIKFAKFSTYLKKQLLEKGISAVAVRCWPDFFQELGAAACSTLSQFIEDGIMSSCESDIHGAITMYIQRELSGGLPPYLGDLVYLDEESNTVVFWHCGAGAYSLANPSTGARAGVHPNRKLGFTLEFGLKPGKVTISRLSVTAEGYRMLIFKGEAVDGPQKFNGTSVEVKLNGNAKEIVHSLMINGFEPHYSIIYSDIADELVELCKLLQIETVIYS
jgi:L-fucose isomerase-like protein